MFVAKTLGILDSLSKIRDLQKSFLMLIKSNSRILHDSQRATKVLLFFGRETRSSPTKTTEVEVGLKRNCDCLKLIFIPGNT